MTSFLPQLPKFFSLLFSSASKAIAVLFLNLSRIDKFKQDCKNEMPSGSCSRGGSRGRVQGLRPPPLPHRDDLRFSNTTTILQKKTMWFIGVEVEQETSAPSRKKILDPPLCSQISVS